MRNSLEIIQISIKQKIPNKRPMANLLHDKFQYLRRMMHETHRTNLKY